MHYYKFLCYVHINGYYHIIPVLIGNPSINTKVTVSVCLLVRCLDLTRKCVFKFLRSKRENGTLLLGFRYLFVRLTPGSIA